MTRRFVALRHANCRAIQAGARITAEGRMRGGGRWWAVQAARRGARVFIVESADRRLACTCRARGLCAHKVLVLRQLRTEWRAVLAPALAYRRERGRLAAALDAAETWEQWAAIWWTDWQRQGLDEAWGRAVLGRCERTWRARVHAQHTTLDRNAPAQAAWAL